MSTLPSSRRLKSSAWPPISVKHFDAAVNQLFEKVRGNSAADFVFYRASALAENSKIWMLLSFVTWLRGGDRRFIAKRAFIAIFAESAIVNLGIKSIFRRQRPDHSGDHPHNLREPWTSSFPSGHATSAFCAATLLSDGDPILAPLYFIAATIIALSRIHVKMHHASDVLCGIGIGLALGRLGKTLAPRRKC